ncbi:transport-energizing ATPase, TRC40/GET3/ArsA family [Rubrobacter radiotolerans]|uniref:arsenite-transporting ATPase n=1 Tax=Rubrobacter radiotolerans TaxID=42256 RepID=A0A023X2B3_RUBRA|nr:ArsA family ATPase [Rubrobacter radiotolerans]AHY46572.1 transport-energizing ATPase, TRC40/GET3/ArsA family [Rubrobacter radiotolerans]MDX5893979.1 ArsA family ATPase [Rubrobacter radiotolerans]
MTMRTILYTGKGGVGKTSVAAATALKAARAGKRVLVMSTDPAHSLADAFDEPIGSDPKSMTENLWAQEMDQGQIMEENWSDIQDYVSSVFEWQGADELEAEELAMLPGMDELFGLLMVRRHHQEARYDALIVDAAPTGETLKLLSLPDQMSWFVEKVLPVERRVAKVIRPFARPTRNLPPLPEDSFFGAVKRFYEAVASVEDILTDRENASIRLVANAEKMVVAEARRAYTYLNLYSYGVDAVVVNRLLPESVSDPYFAAWRESQERHMRAIKESFSPIPILTARLFDREMFGLEALSELAEDVFAQTEPLEMLFRGRTHEIAKNGSGYEVLLHLPLVEKSEVDLSKKGAELTVKVGGYRRSVLLPDSLARLEATGASVEGENLKVRLEVA